MAVDRRTYVRVHDGLPDHPKIAEVGGMAAWLYVSGLCYSSRHLTDGIVPVRMVGRLTDLPDVEALASRLLEANLWHRAQHDCKECPQGLGDVYIIHDYLDHQRSAQEVKELSAKRSAAGRNGGKASGESRRSEANAQANAKQVLQQTRSKTEAETETETETELKNQNPSSSVTATPPPDVVRDINSKSKRSKKSDEPRADVEALCNRLVEMMAARGCRNATKDVITNRWHDAARLLLDKDGVHPQFAMDVLEWSQKHHFWKTNVLSMPKFREKWNTLYQQAEAACGPHPHGSGATTPAPGAEVVSFGGNVVALPIPGQRESATAKARAQVKASGLIARQMIYGTGAS